MSPGRSEPVPGSRKRTLLVTSVRTGDTEIFAVDPDTGDARNLTRSPKSEDRYPCWSPDGKRVAFVSDRNGTANLYVMDADGENVKCIVETKSVCYMPSWQRTADGEQDDVLDNAGTDPRYLFKSGGALDLMLGTDPKAPHDRRGPAAGDGSAPASRAR